jgi:hypothetical protein
VREVKKFLAEFANLRDDVPAGKRFMLRFVGTWPEPGRIHSRLIAENMDRSSKAKPESEQIDAMLHKRWILPIRDSLRNLWTADFRTRWFGVFRILDDVFRDINPSLFLWPSWKDPQTKIALPPPTPFERALQYLTRPNVTTGFCANSECPAPYFFPDRRGQKYCSEACAAPAQREFKRRWWKESGPSWRKKRETRGLPHRRKKPKG